jgi:hypothetical protein
VPAVCHFDRDGEAVSFGATAEQIKHIPQPGSATQFGPAAAGVAG